MKKITLLLLLLSSFSFYAQSTSEINIVNETVKKNTIKKQIFYLASDDLKGRETGSPEIDTAAHYIAKTFKNLGVKPINGSYYQNVPLTKNKKAKSVKLVFNEQPQKELILLKGKDMSYNKGVVILDYGLESEYSTKDVKGKVVICKTGTPEKSDFRSAYTAIAQKQHLAAKYGAIALIEIANYQNKVWQLLKNNLGKEKVQLAKAKDNNTPIAHLWVLNKDIDLQNNNLKQVNLEVNGAQTEKITSKNVVGILEGSDPILKNEFVIYSAHYDHIGIGKPNQENDSIYNGARDNAVGVVTVLSAAENLAKYPTKRSALFILFTAEEKGLIGSKYYTQNPLVPMNKVVFCFNSDGGGYNDKTKTTIIGLKRTTAQKHIEQASKAFGLEAIGDPVPEQNLFDRSDNVHFAKAGIPAPTYSPGMTAFDEEILKYYHQAADNPETLDYDYLELFFKSYVLSARLIANDPEKPFWLKGDKYYEAGEKLYNK